MQQKKHFSANISIMKLSLRRASLLAVTTLLSVATYLACLTVTLSAPAAEAASCAAIPSSLGTVTLNVNAPASGTYRVWVRMLAPSQSANTFYVQIQDAGVCGLTMGGASITPNQWTWIDYDNGSTNNTLTVNLTSGSHEIQLAGKSAGVEVDTLLLLSDATCVPTGTGGNCTAAAVASVSPTASPSPSGTGSMTAMTTPSSTSNSMSSMSAPQASHASFFAKYRGLFIALALIIIAIPLIWLAVQHFMNSGKSSYAEAVPVTDMAGSASPAAAAGAPSGTIYPETTPGSLPTTFGSQPTPMQEPPTLPPVNPGQSGNTPLG